MEAIMDLKTLVPWRVNGGGLATTGLPENTSPIFGLHRQIDRLFDDFSRDIGNPLLRGVGTEWPAIEVLDEEKETKVVAELPGMEEKDIDLSLRDGVLTI